MKIPDENLNAMIQFLWDISETSGDHFMVAATMLRSQQYYIEKLESESPRCECCGYLVHQSEHLGCIRAADKMDELDTSESVKAWVKIAKSGRAYIATEPTEGYTPVVSAYKLAELEAKAAIGRRALRMLRKHNRYLGESVGETTAEWCIECDNSGPCSDNCELAAILRDAEQVGEE